MRTRMKCVGALLAAVALGGSPGERNSDLVVHEWGTFLAMSGSNGVTLDGMYHEEHALPAFVHARSRDQLRIPSVRLKGETPVIYFYTKTAQDVRVGVRFPQGIWTQWYPQAQRVGPQFAQMGSPAEPRGGWILWCGKVIPADGTQPAPPLPTTSADALWNHAREVDAAYVQTPDWTKPTQTSETERFLFYRGLGRAEMPLTVNASEGGTLNLKESAAASVSHVFVIRVEGGKGTYSYRPELRAGESVSNVIPSMEKARPLSEFVPALADDLAARLVASGLYAKEARAMVNTWRTSYFTTEGVRVLFVLPQSWTDAFIPLKIAPKPAEVVRVMVGRVELLTAEREAKVEAAVRDLASDDSAVRGRGFDGLRDQGRYAEPIVRRVLETSRDDRVRSVCKRLLTADFVTDLRSALKGSTEPGNLADQPVHVRAQLASLLRDVGLEREAKTEAEAVITALKAQPAPPLSDSDSRQYLRSYARAMEGLGDVGGQVRTYETFIRFGSQVADHKDCRGCHQDAGPRAMSWYRDWWAGRKYARAVERQGGLDAAIAEHEATLRQKPGDVETMMALAYLYEVKGQDRQAAATWLKLEASSLADRGN